MDYLEIANSIPMWIAAGIAVLLVLVEAIIFVRKSIKDGKRMGLKDEQIKTAIKSSAYSSIGPSLAILAGMISLLVTIGGPISWMRLSFIGSVMFELMAAGFGTEAVGVELGSADMSATAYATAVWTMVLGGMGWILFSALFTDKLESLRTKVADGSKKLIPIISSSAMLGAFAYMTSDKIIMFDRSTVALLVGAVVMLIVMTIADEKEVGWLKEWGLAISMFSGMFAAVLF